jgi:hypothetical protein
VIGSNWRRTDEPSWQQVSREYEPMSIGGLRKRRGSYPVHGWTG